VEAKNRKFFFSPFENRNIAWKTCKLRCWESNGGIGFAGGRLLVEKNGLESHVSKNAIKPPPPHFSKVNFTMKQFIF